MAYEILTDDSPMPFGKYKGEAMSDVPASYLHWLWTNGMNKNFTNSVHLYIKENLTVLKQEHPDGIWS